MYLCIHDVYFLVVEDIENHYLKSYVFTIQRVYIYIYIYICIHTIRCIRQDLHQYNIENREWNELPHETTTAPMGRFGHTAVVRA